MSRSGKKVTIEQLESAIHDYLTQEIQRHPNKDQIRIKIALSDVITHESTKYGFSPFEAAVTRVASKMGLEVVEPEEGLLSRWPPPYLELRPKKQEKKKKATTTGV